MGPRTPKQTENKNFDTHCFVVRGSHIYPVSQWCPFFKPGHTVSSRLLF